MTGRWAARDRNGVIVARAGNLSALIDWTRDKSTATRAALYVTSEGEDGGEPGPTAPWRQRVTYAAVWPASYEGCIHEV